MLLFMNSLRVDLIDFCHFLFSISNVLMHSLKITKQKGQKNGSPMTIRIRRGSKSINMNGQKTPSKPKEAKNFQQQLDIQQMLRQIPKTVEHQDGLLVEGIFSYVDEGMEKWKIGKTIGKGNSYVKRALNIKNGKIVAVKQVVLGSDEETERLEEIKILKKLNHPNIVSYLEHYKIKNETWIFMEYIDRNLRTFILEYGPLPSSVFFIFTHQIVKALAELQRKNIMHKDIKCENILIDNDGTLKLCDFGCSKDFRSTMSLQLYERNSAIKSFKGSYLWTAPECLLGQTCQASDIWSLGCLMIELISGQLPWHDKNFDNQFQAIRHIVESDQTPKIEENWEPRVKQLISCCLQRKPEDRITAYQLLERNDFWG